MKFLLFLLLPLILFSSESSESSELDLLRNYLDITKVDYVLQKDTFSVFYSYKYKQPIYTVSILTPENVLIKSNRKNLCDFEEDKAIIQKYRSTLNDYRGSGYDRGHISSYASSDFTIKGAKESCLLSNMSPQTPHFNRVEWRKIESQTRDIAKLYKIKVVTIVFFDNNPWNNKFLETGNHLQIPDGFAKLILKDGKIIKHWFIEHK